MNDDIDSRLDNIEDKIDGLDRHHSDSSGFGWLFIGVFLYFAFSAGSGDLKFNLPKNPPNTVKSEAVIGDTSSRRYFIIYNEDFAGYAKFSSREGRVFITLKNISKLPYRFHYESNGVEVTLWTNDDIGYGLLLDEDADKLSILNPGETAVLSAKMDSSPAFSNVKGFTLISRNESKIRFGYAKLSWWDQARWWLAEKIRK